MAKDSPSQALQMLMRNLDNAYTNFFKGKVFLNLSQNIINNHFNYPRYLIEAKIKTNFYS